MSKINMDFLTPEVAVRIARRELAEFDINDSTSLAGYFPSQEVNDIEYEIEVGADAGFITAANWRAFNGNTTSEVWGGGQKSRGRIMPLARNFTLDEESALRMRNDSQAMIERESAMLVRRAARAIAIAVNIQRANALQNGRVEINGSGGLRQTVDFGRDKRLNLTASKLFSDPTADPLAQIEEWTDLYEEINGFRPEQVMIPTPVLRQINQHKNVVLAATGNEHKPRATQSELQTLFSEYRLPDIVATPRSLVQVDNLETGKTERKELFDQTSILFTPKTGDPRDPNSSVYGRTLWGKTMTAELPEFRSIGEAGLPGIVAAVIEEGWPYHKEVIADALAMPVAFNANYTLKAKVIDDPKPNNQ